ncbi:MAG: hypothetical protein HRT38_16920 [Alteromonadaceae bacterium]|nr:hypothetical protein [Alteromonadaceae bacterium]
MRNIIKKTFASAVIATVVTSVNAQEVELVNSWNMDMYLYGSSWKDDAFTVVVDDLGANKKVFIHHQAIDGSWVDLPMSYHSPASAGKEVWTSSPGYKGGSVFSVKYEVNGQTYWDNNQGQNYSYPNGGYNIASDNQVLVATYNSNSSDPYGNKQFTGRIALKNLSYLKSVKVVYSQDNWQTSKIIDAKYGGNPFRYGYGSHQNPNSFNVETWTFSEYVSPERGEFFVDYEVNGQHYYDNNHGVNYDLNPVANYPAMFLRRSPYWESVMPLTLVRDNTWSTILSVEADPVEFKFDANSNWEINFGDNDNDGIADQNGSNIVIDGAGKYRIEFNDQTLSYSVQNMGPLS